MVAGSDHCSNHECYQSNGYSLKLFLFVTRAVRSRGKLGGMNCSNKQMLFVIKCSACLIVLWNFTQITLFKNVVIILRKKWSQRILNVLSTIKNYFFLSNYLVGGQLYTDGLWRHEVILPPLVSILWLGTILNYCPQSLSVTFTCVEPINRWLRIPNNFTLLRFTRDAFLIHNLLTDY